MNSILWQCTLVITFCLVAQCMAASSYESSKYLPDKYFSPKRTKPSLSIVNPLDVLRQRVMIEMARRQRENAIKQAEVNREILRSIGKRGYSADYNDIEEYLRNRYYDMARVFPPMPNHPEMLSQQQQPSSVIHSNVNAQGLSQKNSILKADNENKLTNGMEINEPSQEQQMYAAFEDGSTSSNNNNDDDESQVKYLYSLLKSRINSNNNN